MPSTSLSQCFSFTQQCEDNSQAFVYLDPQTGVLIIFTYSKFLKVLCSCLTDIGVNLSLYAGHSFRCGGGASFAYQTGIPLDMINLLGDWKSDAVFLYLNVPLKMRLWSCNMITKRILLNFT